MLKISMKKYCLNNNSTLNKFIWFTYMYNVSSDVMCISTVHSILSLKAVDTIGNYSK